PALMLLAQSTERVRLQTRIVGAFNRAPNLLASGAAWVDRVAPGRFMLGLGASLPREVRERLGIVFDRPGPRMRDVVTIIRALWGDDLPGVERKPNGRIRYHGAVLSVDDAYVDIVPIQRVPILVAAAGKHMLRVAGALADGCILELVTPGFCRWAWEQIAIGAATTGRSLDGFIMCVQGTFVRDNEDRAEHITGLARALDFEIGHCVNPEFEALWNAGGLLDPAMRVRAAVTSGNRALAEQIVKEEIWPVRAVFTSSRQSLWRWLESHIDAGVTMFSLPPEIRQLMGVSVEQIRARCEAYRVAASA
ncbi:MAG: LLM class flavin-dependent oxidoreductase, partial [Dehalococcoidia bacterium]|nr:LLM class flavin-dependent oxidoreductase [Dehalococcoidia bacterium]